MASHRPKRVQKYNNKHIKIENKYKHTQGKSIKIISIFYKLNGKRAGLILRLRTIFKPIFREAQPFFFRVRIRDRYLLGVRKLESHPN